MSIASEISRLQTAKSALKTSIENKGVTVPSATTLDGYAALVDQISGSGDDVRFIDYDGTVLYSYSATEFANLSAMPANPSHSGLTAQGWNWTLADAKTYVATHGWLDIGQMYVTDDGVTKIYITLESSNALSPYFALGINGTVNVNWGDGTSTDLSGSSLITVYRTQHIYSTIGEKIISITPASGTQFAIHGTDSSGMGSYLLTRTNSNAYYQDRYQNTIQKVELGTQVNLGKCAFAYCKALKTITMPNYITSIGQAAFSDCYHLSSITIPSSVTTLDTGIFNGCNSLKSIALPNSITSGGPLFNNCRSIKRVALTNGMSFSKPAFGGCYSLEQAILPSTITTIPQQMFANCESLKDVTIPNGVTSIGNSSFNGCECLEQIVIPNTVTLLDNAAFAYCDIPKIITVPSSVTTINASVFRQCYGVSEYHFLRTSPPTLANTNVFEGILSDCKIYVPSASLSSYQSATNWSNYRTKMVGE